MRMRDWLFTGLVLMWGTLPAPAGEAAFADDGKTVYAIHDVTLDAGRDATLDATLDLIHVDTGEINSIKLPGMGDIDGICRAEDGAFYLVSANTLWRWKPGNNPPVEVEKAKSGCAFKDVACSDDQKQILIVGTKSNGKEAPATRLFYRAAPDRTFVTVWLRHLEDAIIRSPEFLPDGSLLFSAEGDLWHGELSEEPTEYDNGTQAKPIGTLAAYRYAPLAERYAYPGTPAEQGVRSIASGAGRIYVHVARIGGSGWGHLSSLSTPEPGKEGRFTAHNQIEDALSALQSVRRLFENGGQAYLCASPDRSKVYMTGGAGPGRTHYLVDKDDENATPAAFRIGDKVLISK